MSQAPADLFPHDYQSALELLYGRINYEKTSGTPYNAQNFRLDRMREILKHLDNPHERYPIIHVAGTKGKGTTATLLYDALRANQMRAGLYTSPHLVRLEERFRLDGRECTQSELVELTRQTYEAVRKVEQDGWGCPTFFEMTTAMGFLYFAQQKADCVVLEVGLGGRLDSTNICLPVLSVITSISMDHQAQLGDTIEAIAGEKAGIIKPGVPVLSTAGSPEARQVISRVASEKAATLYLLDRDFSATWNALAEIDWSSDSHLTTSVASVHYRASHPDLAGSLAESVWTTRMLGRHQAQNLAGAVTALAWLSSQAGWRIDPELTRQALAESHAEARLQILGHQPTRIIDTAHNPASISAGLQAMDDHFADRRRTIVFACSRDKDYRAMLRQILPTCSRLICTTFLTNPRAVSADSLQSCALQLVESLQLEQISTGSVECIENPGDAWRLAIRESASTDLVVAMGSFFLAAELLELHQQATGESVNP